MRKCEVIFAQALSLAGDEIGEVGLVTAPATIFEFMTYDHGSGGRIVTNEAAETSLKGLYAVGDELANGISNASGFRWISGEKAVDHAKQAATPDGTKINEMIDGKPLTEWRDTPK